MIFKGFLYSMTLWIDFGGLKFKIISCMSWSNWIMKWDIMPDLINNHSSLKTYVDAINLQYSDIYYEAINLQNCDIWTWRAYWRWNHKYQLPKYCGITPMLQVLSFKLFSTYSSDLLNFTLSSWLLEACCSSTWSITTRCSTTGTKSTTGRREWFIIVICRGE